jgi:hypothetical protein
MSTTVEIMGGLGNQLFQIVALISHCMRTKRSFYFENKPITHGERKKYYWDTALLHKLKGFIKPSTNPNNIVTYNEPAFHYTAIPFFNPQQTVKLIGYFQSYKYFEEHKELIFRLINLKESQRQIREKVASYLPTTDFDNIVSLHFRLGDYKHQQHNHPVMPVEYYEKALEQLLVDTNDNDKNNKINKNNDKKAWFILYFCEENDIAYVNEKINTLKQNEKFKELTFIKVPSNLEDWEQMLTMSLCKHHIIANSTFSWWGAYFSGGENKDKLVYYPSIWFGQATGVKKMDDMFLEGWEKISVE